MPQKESDTKNNKQIYTQLSKSLDTTNMEYVIGS